MPDLTVNAVQRAPRWLIAVIFLLAIANGIEAAQTLIEAAGQYALNLSYSPVMRVAISIFWMVLFVRISYELVRRIPNGLEHAVLLLTAYGGWAVLSLILFARSDYDRGRIVFQAAITAILLIPVWVMGLRRRYVQ